MTVAKLRGARERKRRQEGKCEGRKGFVETRAGLVGAAKAIRAARPEATPAAIAAELEAMGHVSDTGSRYSPDAVNRMLGSGPRRYPSDGHSRGTEDEGCCLRMDTLRYDRDRSDRDVQEMVQSSA